MAKGNTVSNPVDDMSDTDSIRTEDVESEPYSDDSEEELTTRLIDKEDVALRNSEMEGAGKGVFCKRDIEAGTILPYYAVVKKVSEVKDEDDDTYFMSVTYVNDEDKTRNIQSMVADGNPTMPTLKKLPRQLRAASYVNEASKSPPNCVFVNNVCLSKEDIIKAYRAKKPLPITLLVIPHDVDKGDELLTMYGSDYERDYKVWRDRKGYRDAIVNLAHEIVEECSDEIGEMLKTALD
ncbi:unnamed protein product [Sphacelaria rigidula]